MTSVEELYEVWAGQSDLEQQVAQSLDPRGTDWLFEAFAELGPKPGQVLVDVGARGARHAIRLERDSTTSASSRSTRCRGTSSTPGQPWRRRMPASR